MDVEEEEEEDGDGVLPMDVEEEAAEPRSSLLADTLIEAREALLDGRHGKQRAARERDQERQAMEFVQRVHARIAGRRAA